MKLRGTVRRNETTHTKADPRNKRPLVTRILYFSECLIAIYLSMLITVRWRNVAAPNTLITYTDAANSVQYELDLSPCNSTASCTAKKGCPITPITQSVVAKHASATLLVVFRRGLVFTVIMTSPFKTLVKGRERMFKIIRHKSTVYAFLVLSFKLPPKKMERSQSGVISSVWKVALRFLFSSLSGLKFV